MSEKPIAKKQVTKKDVSDAIPCDQVTLRNGEFVVRKSFFYPHGKNAVDLVNKVLCKFPEAKIIDSGEVWMPFRGGEPVHKQSHWFVKFTITESEHSKANQAK